MQRRATIFGVFALVAGAAFGEESLTFSDAERILGSRCVIRADDANEFWRTEVSFDAPIRYSAETLRACKKANDAHTADWRLVFIVPRSLRKMYELRGTDASQPPFFTMGEWICDPAERAWADRAPEAGYYLIDFTPRFGGYDWVEQGQKIDELGAAYTRVHEAVFAQATMSLYRFYRNDMPKTDCHWGSSLESQRRARVFIGFIYEQGKMYVSRMHRENTSGDKDLTTCVMLRFEF